MNTNIIKHEGEINLVGIKLPCYVLEDGTRVFSASETQKVLEKIGTDSIKQGSEINKERKTNSLKPIPCYKGNIVINCYEATVLVDIWEVHNSEAVKTKGQSPKQRLIAEQQEMLFFSFAKTGLTSLIDEATGYQQEREKEELRALTRAYILSRRATGLISESDKKDFFKYLVLRYYSQKELSNWDKIQKSDFGKLMKVLINTPSIKGKDAKKEIK